jgi:hypothetical protein
MEREKLIDPGTREAIESNPGKQMPGFASTHELGVEIPVRPGVREESGSIPFDGKPSMIERAAKHVFLHVA